MDGCEPVHLIMMGNTKKCESKNIKKIYDLKGSMVNREELGEESTFKNTKTLKDKNFLRLKKDQKCMLFRE